MSVVRIPWAAFITAEHAALMLTSMELSMNLSYASTFKRSGRTHEHAWEIDMVLRKKNLTNKPKRASIFQRSGRTHEREWEINMVLSKKNVINKPKRRKDL